MSLLQHVNSLKQRCVIQKQKNDVLMGREVRKIRSLEEQMNELDEAVALVKKIRDGLYPHGDYSREKLFAVQRSQAVLRRKMADLAMQRSQKDIEYERSGNEYQKLMLTQRQLAKKTDKYEFLRKQEIRQYYLKSVRIEENEAEEIIACLK